MKPKYPTSHRGKRFIAHHNGYDLYQDTYGIADNSFWAFGASEEWWVFNKRSAKLDIWSGDCKAAGLAVWDFLFNDPSISPNSK